MLHSLLEQEKGSEVQAIWSVQLIQLPYDLTVLSQKTGSRSALSLMM